jgi:hypothetical protein
MKTSLAIGAFRDRARRFGTGGSLREAQHGACALAAPELVYRAFST